MDQIKIILLFLIFASFGNRAFAQFTECSTGITTELRSSSNGKPGAYQWMGWACGLNGTVIKCDNPPNNSWTNVSGNGIPLNITLDNICGTDGNTALVCGHLNANTWVWKTTNGGSNWIEVFNQPNGMINAVYMKNYLQGFMTGNPVSGRWSLWKTNNGGINWDSTGLYLPQSGVESGWNNSLCIADVPADSNKIWFGTNNNRIYYSSNYGTNWSVISTAPEQNILIISYMRYSNPVTIYAGGSNYLLRSTNYGLNWLQDTVGGSGNITGVANSAWDIFLTRGNKIYRKTQFSSWTQYYTAPAGTYNYIDNRFGGGNWPDHYGVRTNGGITFNTEGEGIRKITDNIPNNFNLSQNYPNPFNPTTNIKFDLPKSGFVKLTIYDALGREVTTLVNSEMKAGSYNADWDASSFASGIYFYKLAVEDNTNNDSRFVETKKMVLVK